MRPHEKLEVWQTAVDFVVNVYKQTERFPKEEKFGLTSQIRRASVSIAANVAEGAGRESTKEFCHFLSNAHVRETTTNSIGIMMMTRRMMKRSILNGDK